MLLSLLKSRIAICLLSAGIVFGYHYIQISIANDALNRASKSLTERSEQLLRCVGTSSALEAAVGSQNAAIAKLKADNEASKQKVVIIKEEMKDKAPKEFTNVEELNKWLNDLY